MLLKNRKLIVTGGPTRQWIDPVRFLTNASSGRMGLALADVGSKLFRETVFIHGPVTFAEALTDKAYRHEAVDSTEDMLRAVLAELEDYAVLVMAAAPADYAPAEISAVKLKKSDDELTLRLKKTPDILKGVAQAIGEGTASNMLTVGFAAETNNLEEYALRKLKEKNLDMICLNDVSRKDIGFGSQDNAVTMYFKDGEKKELPTMSKWETSGCIFAEIEVLAKRQR